MNGTVLLAWTILKLIKSHNLKQGPRRIVAFYRLSNSWHSSPKDHTYFDAANPKFSIFALERMETVDKKIAVSFDIYTRYGFNIKNQLYGRKNG